MVYDVYYNFDPQDHNVLNLDFLSFPPEADFRFRYLSASGGFGFRVYNKRIAPVTIILISAAGIKTFQPRAIN